MKKKKKEKGEVLKTRAGTEKEREREREYKQNKKIQQSGRVQQREKRGVTEKIMNSKAR